MAILLILLLICYDRHVLAGILARGQANVLARQPRLNALTVASVAQGESHVRIVCNSNHPIQHLYRMSLWKWRLVMLLSFRHNI